MQLFYQVKGDMFIKSNKSVKQSEWSTVFYILFKYLMLYCLANFKFLTWINIVIKKKSVFFLNFYSRSFPDPDQKSFWIRPDLDPTHWKQEKILVWSHIPFQCPYTMEKGGKWFTSYWKTLKTLADGTALYKWWK